MARINNLPVVTTGYRQLKLGPYLRGEKSKRNYANYFHFEKSLLSAWLDERRLKKYSNCIKEAPLEKQSIISDTIYEYTEIPHWDYYFKGLVNHRQLVIQLLDGLLQENIKSSLAKLKAPCIGVHIRMGDFRKLQKGEDFSKIGAVRTPEEYFVSMIKKIRELNGSDLPVSVFTDGRRNEFDQLWKLRNIELIEGNRDIIDMLLLSKSKIILTSAGSTFSCWSAFLADAPAILHPDHIHQPLRPDEVNKSFYEGALCDNPPQLLVNNIQAIRK